MLEKLVHFCTRYMAAGVILAGVCGIIWPSLMKPFARYIPIFLGVIMFGMGMSLTPRDFKNVFDHPKNIALGTLFQFIFMPALAFALVKLFALPPAIAIGVILVGCCPGGTASNVISYIARADVALSVSMTMVNTILAPFVTPFLIWVTAGAWVDISFTSMMISIIEMVLLPLLSGVLLNIFFPKAVSKVTKITPMLSALVIIFTVGCVVSLSGRTILDSGLIILCVVILHNLGGMTLGYLAAKKAGMTKAQVRAMSIEALPPRLPSCTSRRPAASQVLSSPYGTTFPDPSSLPGVQERMKRRKWLPPLRQDPFNFLDFKLTLRSMIITVSLKKEGNYHESENSPPGCCRPSRNDPLWQQPSRLCCAGMDAPL